MTVSLQKGNQNKARGGREREQRSEKTSNLQRVPLTDTMFALLKMRKPIFVHMLSANESFNNKLSVWIAIFFLFVRRSALKRK